MSGYDPDFISQCQNELTNYGYCIVPVELDEEINRYIGNLAFENIDRYFHNSLSTTGKLFGILQYFCKVQEIEFIISHRSSENEWEEDGIWHDDGSRVLAFTLSLTTLRPEGGVLELRKKGSSFSSYLITPPIGEMIIFQTGVNGFEHKINAVTKGSRLIIAGWCTL